MNIERPPHHNPRTARRAFMPLTQKPLVALGVCFLVLWAQGCGPAAPASPDAAIDASSGDCPETPCDAGSWCFNGRCEPCDTDTHCGDECVDCTGTREPVCINGGCYCTDNVQCGDGWYCDTGVCIECADDDPEHCGPTCAVCGGDAPACIDGACGCRVSTDCGASSRCNEDDLCEPCDTPEYCGPDCVTCPNDRPLCHEGMCVACIDEQDCDAGYWCSEEGLCELCADDDPLHCGAECLVCEPTTPECSAGACVCTADSCESNYRCEVDGSCVYCDTVDNCGPKCDPCAGNTPFCRPDGTGCVECLGNPDCTAPDTHCDNFVCVPDCLAQGCATDNSPSGEECGNAKIVGRLDASTTISYSGDTTGDGDDDDLSGGGSVCYDAKYDNFYRIYLITGDELVVDLHSLEFDFDAMLKLYSGTDCADNGESDLISCYNGGGNGSSEGFTYTATADGWYTVVVDGRYAFSDDYDYGNYTIDLSLTCTQANCCCP